MAKSQKNRSKNRKVIIHISVMAALSITLGACSAVPDWANPVEWYHDTSDWIWGDDSFSTAKKARADNKRRGNEIPGAGKSFPSLSSVPPRPVGVASSAQRSTIEGGLVADRAQARHAALAPSNLPRRARIAGSPPPPVIAAPPAPKGTRSYRSQPAASPQRRRAPRLTRPVSNAPSAPSLAQTGSINETIRLAIAQQDGRRTISSSVPLIKPITQRSAALAPPPIRRNTMPALSSQRGGIKLTPPPGVQTGSSMHHKAAFSPAGLSSTAKVGVVHFSHGSSKVSGKSRNQLKNIIKKFKERGGNVRVVGHASSRTGNTDPYTHRITNFRLSMARADIVAKLLMQYGVPASKLIVIAQADSQPIYHEFMPSGEAGNRRAEIYLDY